MKPVFALFVTFSALAACGTVMDPVSPDGAPPDVDGGSGADADPGLVTLTIHTSGPGTGVVTSTDGIDCGTACSVELPVGTEIALAATPGAGATFADWGGACDGADPICVLTLTADASVDAAFAIASHTVTIMTAGNGDGAVTSDVGGLACPGTCVATVLHGTELNLTATAAGASSFVGWSGDCTGTAPCSITVTGDAEIHAAFALDRTLVVTRIGTGTGRVTSSPGGIDCGTDCDQVFTAGTVVTLGADPVASSIFDGWNGGGCTGTNDCTVTVDTAVTVSARFTLREYNLNVTVSGNGGVSSNPSGITCPGTCTHAFSHGTNVMLTQTPAAGSTFTGWGGACSGTGACNVTMTQARSVTATFVPSFVVEAEQGGNNGAMIPLGAAAGRACFLSGVGGAFAIGGGDARVYVSSGQWYLGVTGNITAYAQCIAWPSIAGLELDIEYPWEEEHPAVAMGSATNRFCGLTRMAGHYGGGGELIWADVIGGEWMLHGTGLEAHADVSAGARCVTWPASTGLSYTGESLWTQGPPGAPAPDVDLGPTGARACVFTLITGYFLGGGENVYVRPSGGSWHQGGASLQNGVASRARCLTAP